MIPPAAPVTLDMTGMQVDGQYFADPSTGAQGALNILGALDEPYWLDDLNLARRHLAHEYAPTGCLIEANPITIGGIQGMAQLWKQPIPDQEHGLIFAVSAFLAKTTQTANIIYSMNEMLLGTTGMREAVVTELSLREVAAVDNAAQDKTAALEKLMWPPHPYDPELRGRLPFNRADDEVWDEKFPWHPLTRVRAWLRDLDRIVAVDPAFAALPDFQGTTRQPKRRFRRLR